jgi:hypothetical protein
MMKKLFLFAIVAVLFAACGNQPQKNADATQDTAQEEVAELIKLAPSDFEAKAEELVGKHVNMEGTVVHVCSHGGKRMFIVDETSDARIKIEIEDESDDAAFQTELQGAVVSVEGIVSELRIDEAYLAEWVAEIEAAIAEGAEEEHQDHEKGVHLGEEGHENSTQNEDLDRVASLREQIAESGSDHISFFSLTYVSHDILEEAPEMEEGEEEEGHDHDGHDHAGHDHD